MQLSVDGSGALQKSVLLLPALVLSGFTALIASMLSGLLLIDISQTFNISVGIAGQMNTLSFIIAVVFALLTSILSVKYNHKTLLQAGLLAATLSAAGCYFSFSFTTLLASFSVSGIASVLTVTMAFTLTELFPQQKRGEVIGFIIAGMSGSYVVGALIVPYLLGFGGWRYAYLGYMLPSALLTLVLVTIGVPKEHNTSSEKLNLGEGFKSIITNRSAFFSLLGYSLAMVQWQGILTYNTSFYRESFLVSIEQATLIILMGALLYTFGSVVSSRIAGRVERKMLISASILVASLMSMVFTALSFFWVSVGLMGAMCFLVGVMDASSTSQIIEQVPPYAGIMMSLQRAVTQVGYSIGSGIGGMILTFSNYPSMYAILGLFGVVSAIVFHWLTKDTR